ncbi:hypothetical protein BGZ46_005675 [Entomortierella lignicola]|nr:hypothetical protein BGZ46_005675 [Entomortierella lignicola]
MSFIYSFFCDTPADKDNAEVLCKKFFKSTKDGLKSECKQYESEYDQKLRQAEVEFKRTKLELKEQKDRKQMDAVLQVIDDLYQSDEYKGSSESTRSKLETMRSWIDYAAEKAEEHWAKERQKFNSKYGVDETPTDVAYPDEKKEPLVYM